MYNVACQWIVLRSVESVRTCSFVLVLVLTRGLSDYSPGQNSPLDEVGVGFGRIRKPTMAPMAFEFPRALHGSRRLDWFSQPSMASTGFEAISGSFAGLLILTDPTLGPLWKEACSSSLRFPGPPRALRSRTLDQTADPTHAGYFTFWIAILPYSKSCPAISLLGHVGLVLAQLGNNACSPIELGN